jgi:hypothetical protein
VLHFDLNNTLLMCDPAKGLNTVDNVARIVAKSAWGRHVDRKKEQEGQAPHTWELAHDQLNFEQPKECNLLANLPACEDESKVSTYMDFIDVVCPKLQEGSDEEQAERDAERKQMIAKFSQAGGLGSKFKNTYEKLLKNLALPKGAKEELGIVGDHGMEPEQEQTASAHQDPDHSEDEDTRRENERKAFDKRMLRELYGEGRYHMIPSFFRTLMYLKKNKQEFAVVFRTFGTDLKHAVHEFDKFARGEHPCFNGRNGMPIVKMDGAKATKDFRFNQPDEQIGAIYRLGTDVSESVFVQGKDHERVEHDQINMIDQDEFVVTKDHIQMYTSMIETLKKHSVMAIQEDYVAWNSNGRENNCGKLLLVDQADYNTQHIFFDDNADYGTDCIVDVRDLLTGEEIPYKKFMDMYVVKVHPHRAILESDYFVKQIENCEMKRDEEIRRMEAGIA